MNVNNPDQASSRQILSCRGDGELAVFDAFGGDEFVRQLLDVRRLAADGQHFEAVVVVEMTVQSRDDRVAVFVLQIGEQLLQVMTVVVVHQRDAAGDLAAAELLAMFHEMGANHVGDGQRAVVVALLAAHAVEFAQEFLVERDAEAGDGFHGVTLRKQGNTNGMGVNNFVA